MTMGSVAERAREFPSSVARLASSSRERVSFGKQSRTCSLKDAVEPSDDANIKAWMISVHMMPSTSFDFASVRVAEGLSSIFDLSIVEMDGGVRMSRQSA